MHVHQMTESHPEPHGQADDALARCIESCFDCAQACTACADACQGERSAADLRACIRLDLDCADICAATGAIATRRTHTHLAPLLPLLETCTGFCRLCAQECEKHADHHDHCRICAEACRVCERACRQAAPTSTARNNPFCGMRIARFAPHRRHFRAMQRH